MNINIESEARAVTVLCLVVLKACVPKLCVLLYSCCPVWQLVVHLLRYVNIVIKRLLLLLLLLFFPFY